MIAHILGDEADLALCENCHKEVELDDPRVVECEGCSGVFCRKVCWPEHWCGPLTDRNGRVVRLGDLLIYHDSITFKVVNPRVYRVTEMSETFRKHACCIGVEVRGPHSKPKEVERIPLHVRLMEIR